MNIRIGQDYRLNTDAFNFIIEERNIAGKKSKKPGTEKWKAIGYYSTLSQALRGLLWHKLRDSDAESISELHEAVEDAIADIARIDIKAAK